MRSLLSLEEKQRRFWLRVKKTSTCWIWTGPRFSHGYGQSNFYMNGTRFAHRVSWQIKNGTVTTGMDVMHSCDNPPCVRPSHLRLGTRKDNMRDCVLRGRHGSSPPGKMPMGETHYASKLSDEDVRTIQNLFSTVSRKELSNKFGVTPGTIGHIGRGTYLRLLRRKNAVSV